MAFIVVHQYFQYLLEVEFEKQGVQQKGHI